MRSRVETDGLRGGEQSSVKVVGSLLAYPLTPAKSQNVSTYGHKDYTQEAVVNFRNEHSAWVRPVHGEIEMFKADSHQSQRAAFTVNDAIANQQSAAARERRSRRSRA
jgi:hypothetical protein